MLVKRLIEDRIYSLLKNFPIVGILGPRQIGKTTIALNLNTNKDTIYLDLESVQDNRKLSDPELFFNSNKDKCIIIDEIQRKPELFPLLRSVIDRDRVPGRFIILGSASPDLLRHSSETLMGRLAYVELSGINILEIHNKFSVYDHWLKGGFPTPLLTRDRNYVADWYKFFLTTFIERELPNLGLNAPKTLLNRFISMLANNQGGLWNSNNFSKSLGITAPTVKRYMDFLADSYLIRNIYPFFTNAKKRIIKSPKTYIKDSGILHHLLDLSNLNDILGSMIAGMSWEGYCIEQIISSTNNSYEYYFYRTQDGTECDLILAKGGKPFMSCEFKLSLAPKKTKSFTNCINDLNTPNNYLIIPECKFPYPLAENITVCDIYTFLTKFLPEGCAAK